MTATYRARRRLEMQPDVWREPGELVPEAHTWRLLDSWLHTGYIVEAEVTQDEFLEAVDTYCPDDAEWICDLAGVSEGVQLHGPRNTPVRTSEVVPMKPARHAKGKAKTTEA